MKAISLATPIALTIKERQELEALARSRKSEARMRDRARIVLLAASGMPSRGVARDVGCTPGTASKWRVRFARYRMAGLSETGDRGAEPTYGPEHGKRILALLYQPVLSGLAPAVWAIWRSPSIGPALMGRADGMRCVGCGSQAVRERPERTAQGYRRFRCQTGDKQFNERSGTMLNRAQYPSDVISLVVLWRLRYKLSLRDLSYMFAVRGIVFSYEAVREWEAKLTPALAEALRGRRKGRVGGKWHVDESLPQQAA